MHNTLLLLIISLFLAFKPANADTLNEPRIVNVAETELGDSQRLSRKSAVKIITPLGGHGSGTYVKVNGVFGILTAGHVADQEGVYLIKTEHEMSFAYRAWKSRDGDVAFLVLNERFKGASFIRLSNYRDPPIGAQLTYTGCPSSYEFLTITGRLAGFTELQWGENVERMLLMNGFAWFGSSGSGIITNSGDLVGVLSAVALEEFYGHPQILETLIYIQPITTEHVKEIKDAVAKIKGKK